MLKKITICILIFVLLIIGGCSSNKYNSIRKNHTLTVTQEGEGNVITEKNNNTVNLIPSANEGWVFESWQGENGYEVKYNTDFNKYQLELDGDKVVKSVFVREKYRINTSYQGKGNILKEKISVVNNSVYKNGTKIRITAQPDQGWVFSSWEGDIISTINPKEIVVDGEKNITAVFKKAPSLSGNITIDYDFAAVKNNSENKVINQSLSSLNITSNREINSNKEIIIGFKENLNDKEKEKLIKKIGGKEVKYIEALNAAVIKVEELQNKMFRIQSLNGIRYSEPNHQVHIHGIKIPNDSLYSSQWNHRMIDSQFSWSHNSGDSKLRIAVIDTGIDSNHIDLEGRIDTENGYNFVSDNSDFFDDHGHGTHVAGIIGAVTDNNLGISGTTWEGEILPLKAIDKDGNGSYSDIAEALLYAAGISKQDPYNMDPVDVINMSVGGSIDSDILHDAVKKVRAEGVLIVASAGNENDNQVMYPARYPETIAVGAVNSVGEKAAYSNYGSNLDIVAPGGSQYYGVLSTIPSNNYTPLAGTSMAAPHVSGLISLMLNHGISEAEMREVLHKTSIHPGQVEFSKEYGYGLINTNFALNEVQEVKVIVGNKNNNKINSVADTTISFDSGNYSLPEIPTGSYNLYLWIDVSGDNVINGEDYLKESETIKFEAGEDYKKDLTLFID